MTFWLAVASQDSERAREVLHDDWKQLLEDEPTEHVLDFSAATMTCPACQTTFDTGPTDCPDCGLFIGP